MKFLIVAIVIIVGIVIMSSISEKREKEAAKNEIAELTKRYENLELIDKCVSEIEQRHYLSFKTSQDYETKQQYFGVVVLKDGLCVKGSTGFDEYGHAYFDAFYPDIKFCKLGYNNVESENKRIAVARVLRKRIYHIVKNKYGNNPNVSVTSKSAITMPIITAHNKSYEPFKNGFVITVTVYGQGLESI